tara:strand:- start:20166 stop:21008 length:843 start_codon:yes stop_codon:yes gene_type:complete
MTSGDVISLGWMDVDYVVYTFHMPLFMLLAGMNVPRSLERPGFLRKKLQGIAWPYFLWSIIHGVLMIGAASAINGGMNLGRLLEIPYNPISPFWFLYVLFLYMVLVTIWRPGIGLLTLAVVLFVVSPIVNQTTAQQFCYFMLFFVAGCIMKIPNWPRALLFGGGVAFTVGLGLVFVLGLHEIISFYAPGLLPIAAAGIAMICGAAMILRNSRFLQFLGRMSMAIYVMHVVFTAGSRMILHRIGLENEVAMVAASTLIGVSGPIAGYYALRMARLSKLAGL